MPSPRLLCSAVLAASSLLGASRAQADLTTNAEVTGNIIFGSGNADGGFVVFQDPMTGLELGLRAKVRYPAPLNVFNNSGNVYTHAAGLAGPGLSRAFWSFDYSVNTNYNGAGNSFDLAEQFATATSS